MVSTPIMFSVLLECLFIFPGLISAASNTYVLGCPPDSIDNNGWCYFFDTKSNITWDQTFKECARRGGKPLRIETADEMNFVTTTLQQAYQTEGIWTSLNDWNVDKSAGTGSWLWGTDEYPNKSIIKWNKEPDNNDNEDCCAINVQGKFSDEICSRRLGFICELNGASALKCPPQWLQISDTCYYFSSPTDYTHIVTWQKANSICSSWAPVSGYPNAKAHLVTLDKYQDQAVLRRQLLEITGTTMQWWTGLNDRQIEGQYQWVNGDTYTTSYVSWAVEPDNIGKREQCGFLLMDGTFSDRNCNELHGYACRKDEDTETNLSNMGCDTWIRGGQKCYVLFDAPKKTWQQAKQACQEEHGQLLKLATLDEATFVNFLLREINNDQYWIGLNDIGHDKTFVWADGSYSNPYILNWNKAPDNLGSLGGEDCAVIQRNGFWEDVSCQADWLGYLCEMTIKTGQQCPTGWISRPGSTSCYYFSDGSAKLTWSESQAQCIKMSQNGQAYLFAMSDANERTWMRAYLGKMPNSTPFGYWTGMNDIALEGTWLYDLPAQTRANMKLIDWSQEPNNWKGNEQCVQVINGGRLNDNRCDYKIGFICERPVSSFSGSLFGIHSDNSNNHAPYVKPVLAFVLSPVFILYAFNL